jgi:hypothetical protein
MRAHSAPEHVDACPITIQAGLTWPRGLSRKMSMVGERCFCDHQISPELMEIVDSLTIVFILPLLPLPRLPHFHPHHSVFVCCPQTLYHCPQPLAKHFSSDRYHYRSTVLTRTPWPFVQLQELLMLSCFKVPLHVCLHYPSGKHTFLVPQAILYCMCSCVCF